jgi:D-apionolactonase
MNILHAGPIQVGYENGFLRRMNYDGDEIIRMIYFAVRDHNWNTLSQQIDNENITVDGDTFRITYDCLHVDGGVIIMAWKVEIAGGPDGTITFQIEGIVRESFRKNRAGFCVLHPLSIAGNIIRLTHADSTQSARPAPTLIAADNPFKNIKAMEWHVSGNAFQLLFDGDIFETEDQRNWGDASFKTFCTPLDKPFPVELQKGDKVYQRVTFKPLQKIQTVAAGQPFVSLKETGQKGLLPLMGIGSSTEIGALSGTAAAALRSLRLSHYRIDVHPASDTFAAELSQAYENAYSVGLGLEVALHLTDNFSEEMEAFMTICLQNKVRLKKVLLLNTNGMVTGQPAIDQLMSLKRAFPKVLFGAGTNYNFNELNKNLFQPSNIDFISFAMDPQEHAADDLTILENAGSLEDLVRSAKGIYGGSIQVHVSPLALRKRFNPYATNPDDFFIAEAKKADPRQKETFAAAWALACIISLTRGDAASVTFFQTVGNQGILSADGQPYPVYEVFKNLAGFHGTPVVILESSDPLSCQGMLVDGKLLAMVNLSDESKSAQWNGVRYSLAPKEVKFHPLNRTQ